MVSREGKKDLEVVVELCDYLLDKYSSLEVSHNFSVDPSMIKMNVNRELCQENIGLINQRETINYFLGKLAQYETEAIKARTSQKYH